METMNGKETLPVKILLASTSQSVSLYFFSVQVCWNVRQNRSTIHDIQLDKQKEEQKFVTNCYAMV